MDLRLYDEFIIDNALKDENFKEAYIELLFKLSAGDVNKYKNFEEFESEEAYYLEDGVHFDQTRFTYYDGIDLRVKKGEDLYYFYTYEVDFDHLNDNDMTKQCCGEMCCTLTKEDAETGRKSEDFVLRMVKTGDEYKLLVDEYDPALSGKRDRRIYDLSKEQVEDIIAYIKKVKSESFGV